MFWDKGYYFISNMLCGNRKHNILIVSWTMLLASTIILLSRTYILWTLMDVHSAKQWRPALQFWMWTVPPEWKVLLFKITFSMFPKREPDRMCQIFLMRKWHAITRIEKIDKHPLGYLPWSCFTNYIKIPKEKGKRNVFLNKILNNQWLVVQMRTVG